MFISIWKDIRYKFSKVDVCTIHTTGHKSQTLEGVNIHHHRKIGIYNWSYFPYCSVQLAVYFFFFFGYLRKIPLEHFPD